MGLELKSVRLKSKVAVVTVAILLGACAATAPTPDATGAPAAISPDLACTLSSNCVNSLGTGGLVPLRYVGTPTQVLALLQATLTGIDAVAHAVESYVTSKRNPVSQMFAREAWRLLEVNLEKVLTNPRDLEARGAMQMGAFLAGTAIENSMLGVCHACANPLTAHYGITHGQAIGVLLPHVIRFNAKEVAPLYADLIAEAGLRNGHPAGSVEALAQRVHGLMAIANLPTTLSSLGVSRTILPILAEEASQQWTARFNPRAVDEADLVAIFDAAM